MWLDQQKNILFLSRPILGQKQKMLPDMVSLRFPWSKYGGCVNDSNEYSLGVIDCKAIESLLLWGPHLKHFNAQFQLVAQYQKRPVSNTERSIIAWGSSVPNTVSNSKLPDRSVSYTFWGKIQILVFKDSNFTIFLQVVGPRKFICSYKYCLGLF